MENENVHEVDRESETERPCYKYKQKTLNTKEMYLSHDNNLKTLSITVILLLIVCLRYQAIQSQDMLVDHLPDTCWT